MPYARNTGDSWLSVIHVTTGIAGYGFHNPDIYYNPQNGALRIHNSINGNADYTFTTTQLQVNIWSSIEVAQVASNGQFVFTVQINNIQVHAIQNTDARSYPDGVSVHGGNWLSMPAPVWIREFDIQTNQIQATHIPCSSFGSCNKSCGGGTRQSFK